MRDPVCGMSVDPHKTPHRQQHAGRTYYFCSAGCREKFASAPAKYLATAEPEPPPSVPAGTIYTCPMHLQIRQVGPGVCPICGMSKLRVEQAKALLANPAMSVTQVGFNLGFSETSSFTTTFRKHTGLTPTAYRRGLV